MIDPQLPETPTEITHKTLWEFAGLWLLFWTGLAAWQWFRGDATAAAILGVVAAGVGIPGLLQPAVVRPLFRSLLIATFPIGWIVSRLIVLVLFFGLITPVALFFRLLGRDVLHRRHPPPQESYWSTKPQPTGLRSYFHPY